MARKAVQVHDGDGTKAEPFLTSRVKQVSQDQIETAIEWLDSNEGDGGERDACQATIRLLQRELARRKEQSFLALLHRKATKLAREKGHTPELAKAFADAIVQKQRRDGYLVQPDIPLEE